MRRCRECFECWMMENGLSASSMIKVVEFIKNPTWEKALAIMGFPEIDIVIAFITTIPAMKRYKRFIECLEMIKKLYDYLLWVMELMAFMADPSLAFAENIGLLTTIFPIVSDAVSVQQYIHPSKPDSYLPRMCRFCRMLKPCKGAPAFAGQSPANHQQQLRHPQPFNPDARKRMARYYYFDGFCANIATDSIFAGNSLVGFPCNRTPVACGGE